MSTVLAMRLILAGAGSLLFFCGKQGAVARLIPKDETGPGALEAGAPEYIDRQLAGAWARATGCTAAARGIRERRARATSCLSRPPGFQDRDPENK
jgi:hypothetical protein